MIEPAAGTETDEALYGEERAAEEPTAQFCSFRLGAEWYGIPIARVREVVRVGQIAFLPSAPPHVAGIINLRGSIVSVTDPKRLFGLPPTPRTSQNRIVVIEHGAVETGLLLDEVGEVVTVPHSALEPPLVTFEPSQTDYIEHVCRRGDRLLAVLRAEKLLGPGAEEIDPEKPAEA
jgi:purine-binding chemotaxis protein CheW